MLGTNWHVEGQPRPTVHAKLGQLDRAGSTAERPALLAELRQLAFGLGFRWQVRAIIRSEQAHDSDGICMGLLTTKQQVLSEYSGKELH